MRIGVLAASAVALALVLALARSVAALDTTTYERTAKLREECDECRPVVNVWKAWDRKAAQPWLDICERARDCVLYEILENICDEDTCPRGFYNIQNKMVDVTLSCMNCCNPDFNWACPIKHVEEDEMDFPLSKPWSSRNKHLVRKKYQPGQQQHQQRKIWKKWKKPQPNRWSKHHPNSWKKPQPSPWRKPQLTPWVNPQHNRWNPSRVHKKPTIHANRQNSQWNRWKKPHHQHYQQKWNKKWSKPRQHQHTKRWSKPVYKKKKWIKYHDD